ncbi:unnamed protein product, partial [Polarella glacialis]
MLSSRHAGAMSGFKSRCGTLRLAALLAILLLEARNVRNFVAPSLGNSASTHRRTTSRAAQRFEFDSFAQQALTSEEREALMNAPLAGSGKRIYVLSDSTGETAKLLIMRLLVQYPQLQPQIHVFGGVRTPEQMSEIFQSAKSCGEDCLIFATLVDKTLAGWMGKLGKEQGIRTLNVMEPLLRELTGFLEFQAKGTPGGSVNMTQARELVNDSFFAMVEAVKFAQQHVSGLNSQSWSDADVLPSCGTRWLLLLLLLFLLLLLWLLLLLLWLLLLL